MTEPTLVEQVRDVKASCMGNADSEGLHTSDKDELTSSVDVSPAETKRAIADFAEKIEDVLKHI